MPVAHVNSHVPVSIYAFASALQLLPALAHTHAQSQLHRVLETSVLRYTQGALIDMAATATYTRGLAHAAHMQHIPLDMGL